MTGLLANTDTSTFSSWGQVTGKQYSISQILTNLCVQILPQLGLEDAGKGIAQHPLAPKLLCKENIFKALGRGRKNYFVEKFRTDYALWLKWQIWSLFTHDLAQTNKRWLVFVTFNSQLPTKGFEKFTRWRHHQLLSWAASSPSAHRPRVTGLLSADDILFQKLGLKANLAGGIMDGRILWKNSQGTPSKGLTANSEEPVATIQIWNSWPAFNRIASTHIEHLTSILLR